jgi:WD40 repeat protein
MLPARESSAAAFHPTEGFFITCSPEGLRRWAVETEGKLGFSRPEPLGPENIPGVTCFTLTRDGQRLAAITDDGFRLLNLAQPASVVRSAPGSRPGSVPTLSPDGRWVALGKRGNRLQICDSQTGKVITNITMAGECVPFFSPDQRWLVGATYEEYQLRHVGSWQLALTIRREGPEYGRRCAAFTPDGKILAIGLGERGVRLLAAGTSRELATLPVGRLITHLCFSPDGTQLLVTHEPGYSQLWDLRLIRQQLAAMNLDWDQPPLAPPTQPLPKGLTRVN